MNTTDAVAVLRAHNKWRRAEASEIPDGIPDTSPPHSARDIGIAINVLCDEIERLRIVGMPPIPSRDEIIKLWDLAMLETGTGLDAMEYFARAILRPNTEVNARGAAASLVERPVGQDEV